MVVDIEHRAKVASPPGPMSDRICWLCWKRDEVVFEKVQAFVLHEPSREKWLLFPSC